MVSLSCRDGFRRIAAVLVGKALGETAMNELGTGKEVDKAVGDCADFISVDDFKPFMDSLSKKSKEL